MRRLNLLLSSLLALLAMTHAAPASAAAPAPVSVAVAAEGEGLETITVATSSGPRQALLYDAVPAPTALVVLLHGMGSDAREMRAATGYGFERLAAQAGWLVAYAQGVGNSWNDCRRTPQYPARRAGVDDVAFLVELVRTLRARYDIRAADSMIAGGGSAISGGGSVIPAHRVLVGGFSNGGHMALRVGLERPDAIGGILVIGAQLPTAAESLCAEGLRSLNALFIAGTQDAVAPYDGGVGRTPDGRALGMLDSVAGSAYRLARGQPDLLLARSVGNRDGNPQTHVQLRRWRHVDGVVELYTIFGGGHTIPQQITTFPSILGATSGDIDTAAVTLEFMRQWSPRQTAGWQRKVDALRTGGLDRRRMVAKVKLKGQRENPPG